MRRGDGGVWIIECAREYAQVPGVSDGTRGSFWKSLSTDGNGSEKCG